MLHTVRCRPRINRLMVILICLSFFFLTNYLRQIRNSSASNPIQFVKSINRSLLLHINGSIKQLGQAYPIYIINLPSRTDRRTETIALMHALDLEAFFVPAYSIDSPEIALYNQNRNHLFFTSTELACWASHMRVWLTIADNNLSDDDDDHWTVIFEDDIDLEMETIRIVQSFPSSIWITADLIYLGHCANPPGKLIYQSSAHIYRVHQAINPSCTHAYAVRSHTAQILISLLSNPSQPVDNAIIQLVKEQHLIVYSIHPPLAIQKAVSLHNPSDVNLADRQSWIYRVKLFIYMYIQWWNGVEPVDGLHQSASQHSNLTRAQQWRSIYETGIWKQIFQ